MAAANVRAQDIDLTDPCIDNMTAPTSFVLSTSACKNFNTGSTWSVTALVDGSATTGYGDTDNNIVSLYGEYGNDEKSLPTTNPAHAHYQKGVDLAANIVPRCRDGSIPTGSYCVDADVSYPPAIVFLFIGFSNCDIEICGGNSDAWDNEGDDSSQTVNGHLPGQPCATRCPNIGNTNPQFPTLWNQVIKPSNGHSGGDLVTQLSFLYQIYSPTTHLVGSHIAVFDGALGHQDLARWDPFSGWYLVHNDCAGANTDDPECNYNRVAADLAANGYSEAQVQAVFLKSSNSFPKCDLKHVYCSSSTEPDAYKAEDFMGNIMRYLKCCKLDDNGQLTSTPRYPNLQQAFVTSRTYGGYANVAAQAPNGRVDQCLSPEPFSYEQGIGTQRLIVAQIKQAASLTNSDTHSGTLTYDQSVWFDWGPYLWAHGTTANGTGLLWCDSTTTGDLTHCQGNPGDFRYGDTVITGYWGDHTHPASHGEEKVANRLVNWITPPPPPNPNPLGVQSFISDWVTPWITK